MSAGGGDVRGDRVGRTYRRRHLERRVGPADDVVTGGHRVDAHPVGRAVGEHGGQSVVGQVLVPLVRHLAFDLGVVAGQGGGRAEGLGRAQRRPDRAVGARGESADHPGVAVSARVGEVVADHRGDLVGRPRVHGWASFDIRAIVGLLVDTQGGGDDDGGRDDSGVNGVVEGLLDLRALRGSVGLAGVPVEELDDGVGLAVRGGVVARCDHVNGQGDPAGGSGPRGDEHAVVGAREGRAEGGGVNALIADRDFAA